MFDHSVNQTGGVCCKDAPWFCVENMPPDVRPEFKSHVNKYRVE